MEALEAIDKYFRSGNSIPVERATIRREEWEALKALIEGLMARAENLNAYCVAQDANLRAISQRLARLTTEGHE